MAMGHTLDALRSRNSASLAPRPASERQMRLDGGYRCASEKNGTSQAVLGGRSFALSAVLQVHEQLEEVAERRARATDGEEAEVVAWRAAGRAWPRE